MKLTKKTVLIALGLAAVAFVAHRSGSRAPRGGFPMGYGASFGAYGNPGAGYAGFQGGYAGYPAAGFTGGGSPADPWMGGDSFYANQNLGTAISTSGGSGYIALGGGDFVSW